MKKGIKTKDIVIWSIIGVLLLAGIVIIIIGNVLPIGNAFGDVVKGNIIDFAALAAGFAGGSWTNLVGKLFLCALIFAICYLVRKVLRMIMERSNRAKTVVTLVDSLIKYGSALAIIFIFLGALGVDTGAIWASVGIITLIIGLGCQALITDIVAGLFLVAENEFNVGEIIVVDGFRGTVQEIGIRSTKIMDAAGDIKIVNNSDIKNVVNLSRELSVASCECGIDYSEPIEKVELLIKNNLDYIKERIPAIVEGPYYKGVSELADSAVVLKILAKCKEDDRFQVARDLNREIKVLFDKHGIIIPFPQVTVSNYEPAKDAVVSKRAKKEANQFADEMKELSANIEEQR